MLSVDMSFDAGLHMPSMGPHKTYIPISSTLELLNVAAPPTTVTGSHSTARRPPALTLTEVPESPLERADSENSLFAISAPKHARTPPARSIASSDSLATAHSLHLVPHSPHDETASAEARGIASTPANYTAAAAARFFTNGPQSTPLGSSCSRGPRQSNVSLNGTPTSGHHGSSPNLVYWLRGLPFQAQRSDVELFLKEVDFNRLDIGLLENGECSGNAFVELKGSKNQAELEELHHAFIVIQAHTALAAEVRPKPRFVEVMPSNPAKRQEQLEHDRTLSRGATRRQRRLQSGSENTDINSSFNYQQTYFNYQQAPSMAIPAYPADLTIAPYPTMAIAHNYAQVPQPQPQPQPQQQQSYYVLSSVPVSVMPAQLFTAPASYTATMVRHDSMPMLSRSNSSSQAFSAPYECHVPAQPSPFFAPQTPVHHQQQQQQQQQQGLGQMAVQQNNAGAAVLFPAQYGASPFRFP